MIERRFFKGAKVRAKSGDKPGIDGHSAVFNEVYDNGWFRETIMPGAFKRVLGEDPDVRCLFNHNPDNILGRTKSGTLRLKEDKDGLYFDNDMPDHPMAAVVRSAIDRGDVDGCSFAFTVRSQTWKEEQDPNDSKRMICTRQITEIDQLYDVGPVTYPAYDGTSVAARSLLRDACWPEGVPLEIRSHVPGLGPLTAEEKRGASAGAGQKCACDCPECQLGDCENCSEPDCQDDQCDHGDRSQVLSDEQRAALEVRIRQALS